MGVLLLVSFIIFFVLMYQKKVLENKAVIQQNEYTYQKQLLEASMEIAEQERRRVAANIHDDVGMMLSVLKLNLTRVNKKLVESDDVIKGILSDSNKLIHDTIASIRSISNDLMPPTLIRLGFLEGITEMCRQINSAGTIEIELESKLSELSMDKRTELHLYRLIKEVINNIIKHSGAIYVHISLTRISETLYIDISHNGVGISTAKAKQLAESSTGIGLKSIFSRVHLTNSNITYIERNRPKVIIQTPLV